MRFIPHTAEDVRQMLATIGVASIEDLFAAIPAKLRLGRPLAIASGASELEVLRELEALARRNLHVGAADWFLGAGTYAHFVPSAVDAIASRAEFYTAYTPYQPEMSQGTLQTIFEWQTLICALTGLEVANASMYDGASASAEAALMAMRITKRSRVVASAGLDPRYRRVIETYLEGLGTELTILPLAADGRSGALEAALDDDTACVILQQPNFVGCVEDLAAAARAVHARGALLVTSVSEALSLALLKAPGELGADIVCGEAQSFGVPPSFGGPHLGFLAGRMQHVRQLPGRIAGETVDARGKRGFVLTLSTREQHIRRERATSNICTNQGLCLLMATVYLALLGRHGLRELAQQNHARAVYARRRIRETRGLSLPYGAPVFHEFAVGVRGDSNAALQRAREAGIVAGLDLASFAPELGPALLVCTTELTTRESIDRLVATLAETAT